MPLKAHIIELRNRLIIAAIGVVLGAVAGWFLYDPVFYILQQPIQEVAAARGNTADVNFQSVGAAFDMKLKVSLFIGAIVSSPVWIYEIWAFVTPGLTKKERGYTLGFMGAAIPLFLLGSVASFFALPNAVKGLTSFTPKGASNIINAQDYLSFVMMIVLMFGIAFVIPVIVVALNMVGILSAKTLVKGWRIIIILTLLFSAIATPTPDAVSMFFLAVPMLVLFVIAWVICAANDRRRKRKAIAEGTWVDPDADDDLDEYDADDADAGRNDPDAKRE
ncbi:twin-arginine translocase subunit TatC [Spelaeicoccus albus]|uniref:Sec-independent protein translocase protein TatC n=1 Tax=Spelaeicoccus albus TaxID=1280376 RepID=A0A7Z0IIE8_9MICO|nr:twin-arginine translocase subunit TatC [Spelaeicoccus albus]NYI68405.1 sec-independent protein translocase protein TatC [Spelaeicoccus albus]